jgi:arylsulfatase A-like enzyme
MMFTRIFISSGILSIAPVFTTLGQEKKLNIVYIMSDDHGYQAISAYNKRLIKTPNIDKLASEGVLFNRAYVTNSICGPSRATLLTGKFSHKNGFYDNRSVFDGSQQTFPKMLQDAGYQTAIVGKWHLVSEPTGFDYWKILPGQGAYYNPEFIENGKKETVSGYVTNLITDFSIHWLEQRDKNKPFCLLVHHKAPHRNWQPDTSKLALFLGSKFPVPANFFDDYSGRGSAAKLQKMSVISDMSLENDLKYTREPATIDNPQLSFQKMNQDQLKSWINAYEPVNCKFRKHPLTGNELAEWKYQRYIQDYLACIASVDENVGRLIQYLEKEGLMENTLIVYTSDQGFYLGEHGWFDKRFMYEESFRTPLIIRYPGGKSGVVNSDLVQNIDYAPTILNAAGVPVPPAIQGRSLVPLLTGKTPSNWRKSLYYHYYEYPAEHSVRRHYGIRTNRYKLIHFYNDIDEWELYDLKKDPSELKNVYSDSKYANVVSELKAELQKNQVQYGDTEYEKWLYNK